jgi:hypothetical protein
VEREYRVLRATEAVDFRMLLPTLGLDGLTVSVAAMSWAAVAFEVVTPDARRHVVVPRRWLESFLRAADDGSLAGALARVEPDGASSTSGPRLLTGAFEPDVVLPREPRMRTSLWRHRRPVIFGVAAGAATGLTALGLRGW